MKLLCIGDVAISEADIPQWPPLLQLSPNSDEMILFNWEFPLGTELNSKPRLSGLRFLANPNAPNVIKKWSPGIATIATNHILDADKGGLACTIEALHQSGFMTVGAGMTAKEVARPLLWETQEGRLAIVNWVFAETHPDWMVVPGPNCWPGIEEAERIIQELKRISDWVLVVVHWSDELFPYPLPKDRDIARELARMGVDVVIGHHPHVVRGMDVIGSCPVFYSVGNFYFSNLPDVRRGRLPMLAPRNREGLGVQLSFRRGKSPEYQVFSFYNTGKRVIHDPFRRASIRFAWVNQPLRRLNNDAYTHWYTGKRTRFDKWWSLWFFGVLRLGFRGSVQRILQKLESRFLIDPK